MARTTVLVLGAGVGGLTAANALRHRLAPDDRVVLLEKEVEHVFAPSLLWLMVGDRRRQHVTKDVRRLVTSGVELVRAEVQTIEPDYRRVVAGGQEIEYDALIVALGAELAPESVPGFAGSAHNFFDLDGALGLHTALERFTGGRIVVAVSAMPYKCPAAPYEAALLIDDFLRRRRLRDRSEIAIYTPEPQPMPVAGPVMGQAVTALLHQRAITFHPNHKLQTIDGERRELVFHDGARAPFDLLAAVPPHRAPRAVRESPLAGAAGWIAADGGSLRTAWDQVYAIGDVASITLANGKPLPKAGVFAHAEALAVTQSLVAERAGHRPTTFDGHGYCWVELGGGQAAFATGNFYAQPNPTVALRRPGRLWHLGKVLFERYWMGEGIERAAARLGLTVGSKALGLPMSL